MYLRVQVQVVVSNADVISVAQWYRCTDEDSRTDA